VTTPDEDLIGYLFNALDEPEGARIEAKVESDPELAARLDRLRLALSPLAAGREVDAPPADLATRTVARLAAHLVETERQRSRTPQPASQPPAPQQNSPSSQDRFPTFPSLPRAPRETPEVGAVGGRFRLDLLVACGIGVVALGLVFSAVGSVRASQQSLACQNNLRVLHVGLAGYAETHSGRYPQIGNGATPTAETFATVLADAGQVPARFQAACPASLSSSSPDERATSAIYTYTLGYRTPDGDLMGLRQPSGLGEEHDLIPIAADYPTAECAPNDGPTSPHAPTMNVLTAGGNVVRTRSSLIGPNGDDIFRNTLGLVAAGTGRTDVVLGRPGDRP
jgi:hypothetical protein